MIDAIDGTATDERVESIPVSERGPAPARIVASFGFWLFLLSDIIIFAALFAAYAVLSKHTDGGPSGTQLFDTRHVLTETACLLASSFTCGVMMIALDRRSLLGTYCWAILTALLGGTF